MAKPSMIELVSHSSALPCCSRMSMVRVIASLGHRKGLKRLREFACLLAIPYAVRWGSPSLPRPYPAGHFRLKNRGTVVMLSTAQPGRRRVRPAASLNPQLEQLPVTPSRSTGFHEYRERIGAGMLSMSAGLKLVPMRCSTGSLAGRSDAKRRERHLHALPPPTLQVASPATSIRPDSSSAARGLAGAFRP